MKTLEEHNAEQEFYKALSKPKQNGIACPKCGAELWDSSAMILFSVPPRKDVHCPECDYTGYRLV